jgi:hypothetical protein
MTVQDTAARVQDQVLDAIKAGQDAVLSAVDTLAETAAPITEMMPAPPFADRFPKAADLVDSYFGFAQKLLANQKDFALKLAEAYRPGSSSEPTRKSSPKAA